MQALGAASWAAALLLFTVTCCANSIDAAARQRVPLVIDTDLGDYMDDTWAIAYTMSRSDLFDVQLITTATMNTTGRAEIVAKFLDSINRTDVAIGVGIETPNGGLEPVGVGPQWNWASGYTLDSYPGVVRHDGVQAMMEAFKAGTPAQPVWLLALAPTTNIAEVLYRDPDLASRVRIITMGGSIRIGYSGVPPPTAEYNIAQNVSASQAVFSTHWANDTAFAPMDTSEFLHIAGANYQKFYQAANTKTSVLAETILSSYTVWYNTGGKSNPCPFPCTPTSGSTELFDLLAAYIAVSMAETKLLYADGERVSVPHLAFEDMHLFINGSGFTIPEAHSTALPNSVVASTWNPSIDEGVPLVAAEVVSYLIHPRLAHTPSG